MRSETESLDLYINFYFYFIYFTELGTLFENSYMQFGAEQLLRVSWMDIDDDVILTNCADNCLF